MRGGGRGRYCHLRCKRRGVWANTREFVLRPLACTADGDALGGFHVPLYGACCAALLRLLRVLNVDKSCDTLALATELFGGGGAEGEETAPGSLLRSLPVAVPPAKNAAFLFLMEHISDGQFLSECPSDAVLRGKSWGETKVRWLHASGWFITMI